MLYPSLAVESVLVAHSLMRQRLVMNVAEQSFSHALRLAAHGIRRETPGDGAHRAHSLLVTVHEDCALGSECSQCRRVLVVLTVVAHLGCRRAPNRTFIKQQPCLLHPNRYDADRRWNT